MTPRQIYKRRNGTKKEINMYSLEGESTRKFTVIPSHELKERLPSLWLAPLKRSLFCLVKMRRNTFWQGPTSGTNFCSKLLLCCCNKILTKGYFRKEILFHITGYLSSSREAKVEIQGKSVKEKQWEMAAYLFVLLNNGL